MSKRKVEIPLFEHQNKFLRSKAPSTGLVSGYGGGKSFIATIKCVRRMLEYRTNVGYYLPTYQLIKDVAFDNFSTIFELFEVPYRLHETDKIYRTPYGSIIMRTMDNPSNIIGYNTGYSLIDEADVLDVDKMKRAYKAIVARARATLPKGAINSIDMVSTPEGFKFLYEYYVKNGNDRRVLIQASTLDNTTLPKSYLDNLYDTYPTKELEAYMHGQFVNLTFGSVYRDFDRLKHIDNYKQVNDSILYIGMDFNITKMAATVSIKDSSIRYVVDEIVDVYDTSEMATEIKYRYPNNRVIIYPDAAGSARNTSGKSDHDILRASGFKVIAPNKNPSVRDRVNAVNKSFNDMNTFINSDKCPSLVEAMEKQSYDKNGEPEKKTGLDHIADAFGYEVYNSTATRIVVRRSNVL